MQPPKSLESGPPGAAAGPERHIGLFSGIMLIAGLIIGSGIFAAPGPLLVHAGSVGAALVVWFLAGVLSMVGAMCYAELGTLIPASGGEYQYLKAAFGPLSALMFTWSNVMLAKPISTASIATVFAQYVTTMALFDPSKGIDAIPRAPVWQIKIVACAAIMLVVALNCLSRSSGNYVQNVFTSAKLLAIFIIVVVGLIWIGKGHIAEFQDPFATTHTVSVMDYGTAMYMALFSYNGWNNLCYSAGELKNPSRNLPLAITISMIVVFFSYELANVAYFSVLPIETVKTSKTVAMQLGYITMGTAGAYFMCLMVICSTFGAINASVFAVSRLTASTAEQGVLFPTFLAHINTSRQTPIRALVFVGVVSCLWTIPGDFTALAKVYAFLEWIFYLCTVVGLLVLRRKMPDAPRPFKVWWPMAVLFALVAAYLVVAPFIGASASGAALYAGCLLGCAIAIPIWFFNVKRPGLLWKWYWNAKQRLGMRGEPAPKALAEKSAMIAAMHDVDLKWKEERNI